jgi:hypothetical protein
MTKTESQAFIQAYLDNVDYSAKDAVTAFIDDYNSGAELAASRQTTSFLDALLMWKSAIQFNSIQ